MLAPACAILEAILFASGDPIPLSRLAAASGIPERELPQLLNDLNTAYQKSGHALQVLLLYSSSVGTETHLAPHASSIGSAHNCSLSSACDQAVHCPCTRH